MTTNIDLAKQISKHVELQLVSLRRADISAHFDPFEMPPELRLTQGYRCSHDASAHSEHGRISISVDLTFAAQWPDQTDDGVDAVSIAATFLLVYSIDQSIVLEHECLEHFANTNGPYNVWPYWRELVQTAASRVGLGGVTVPVFRPVAFELQSQEAPDDEQALADTKGN